MDERIGTLEEAELEGGPEGIGADGYVQLLALYLATGQICESKFLWKRIPSAMKSSSEELTALWGVGQTLWQKDTKAFHQVVGSFQWSQVVEPIVQKIVEGVREASARLIGSAYSCIKVADAGNLMGLEEPGLSEYLNKLGWRVQEVVVFPTEPEVSKARAVSAEDQIAKLTDYVTVLEN